jgi:hypothetical protein
LYQYIAVNNISQLFVRIIVTFDFSTNVNVFIVYFLHLLTVIIAR